MAVSLCEEGARGQRLREKFSDKRVWVRTMVKDLSLLAIARFIPKA